MLVEFTTLRSDLKESYNREVQANLTGQVPFEREEDYLSVLTLNMKDVKDFVKGKAYYNGQVKEAVYARADDHFYSDAILIDYELFKAIWEKANGEKVYKPEDVLI